MGGCTLSTFDGMMENKSGTVLSNTNTCSCNAMNFGHIASLLQICFRGQTPCWSQAPCQSVLKLPSQGRCSLPPLLLQYLAQQRIVQHSSKENHALRADTNALPVNGIQSLHGISNDNEPTGHLDGIIEDELVFHCHVLGNCKYSRRRAL